MAANTLYYFINLVLFVNVVLQVNGEKCTPQYTDQNEIYFVRCMNVQSIDELISEIDATWTKIVIVNRPGSQFILNGESQLVLNSIEIFDLSVAGRLVLQPNAFYSFESLMQLNLTNSKLNEFKSAWFERINFIENVDFSHNDLLALTRDNLKVLAKLKVANFSNNPIASIERNTFADLKRLETLVLVNNRIDRLEFGEATALKSLNLRDNHITEILNSTFIRMSKLERITIAQNNIGTIYDHAFTGLGSTLKFLDLSGNNINQISALTFAGLERSRLAELDLSQNNIDLIVSNGFAQLKLLVTLDLSQNSLTGLNNSMFTGLANIRRFNFQNNDIITVHPNTFNGMLQLDSLDLSNNRIQTINSDIWGNSGAKLKRLILSDNSIYQFDRDTFRKTTALDYFDVSNNELTQLPETIFQPLSKIRRIFISNNYIEEFTTPLIDSLGSIVEFHFSNNKLTFFPKVNHIFPKLIRIGLDGNPWQCPCINDILKWAIQRKIDYKKKGFTDGTKPMCVVTPVDVCVRDLQLVKEHQIVEIFEASSLRIEPMK